MSVVSYGHFNCPISSCGRGRLRDVCAVVRRFRYLCDPLCLAACGAYLVNRLWLKSAFPSDLLHCWFNDFWVIPAALPPVLWVQRKLRWRADDRAPTVLEIAMHLGIWSLICEWIGPMLVPGRTGDWGDVLAYSLGALASGLWWHRRKVFGGGRVDVPARV